MRKIIGIILIGWTLSTVGADPRPLRDDVQVRHLLDVSRRTMRIAKDPRDNTLYTLTATGTIYRIQIKGEDERVGETIARGVRDAEGAWTWTQFRPEEGVPAGVPIDEIRAAAAAAATRATDPIEDKIHVLDTRNNRIITPPNKEVANLADYGIAFPRAIYFDAEGALYVVLDVEAVNAVGEERIATSADHKLNDTQGFDIAADGTFYIGGNSGNKVINVVRGVRDGDTIEWATVARTERIPPGTKNHPHPAIVLSPDDRFVYINSGSRTDHGELSEEGAFAGARELPLSSAILRVPADGQDILIPADEEALQASGYLYADGFRNAFDMAFAANGDLFAADNGPDSDMADEICWVRQGLHYGFPWRMGAMDTAQRFPDYDPAADLLLMTRSDARDRGLFYNDPTYPPPPVERFADPVLNLGPDADRYRDPSTGEVRDASDEGGAAYTLTPHSSPLGLVFDVEKALAPEFRGDGFVLRIGGDCCNLINPFDDPDEDLIHMDLEKVGDNYQARMTRIVEGFSGPIDAEIIGNKIYVIEWSGGRGLWEISLPSSSATAVEEESGSVPDGYALAQNYPNPFNANTTIAYEMGSEGLVELTVYNVAGQKIRDLVQDRLAAGRYEVQWDGRDDRGRAVASGTYIYQLTAGNYQESRTLTLLK